MNPSPLVPANASRSGFTLIELMISIAISLLLVAGINAIFRTTAATIGSGQALIQTTRDLRNAFDTFDSDFGGMLDSGSQPLLMIYNQNQPGFLDKVDEKYDTNYNATLAEGQANFQAVSGSRDGISPTSSPPLYGNMPLIADNRNQRVDIVSFFSSGHFRRQTGLQVDPGPDTATYQSLYTSDTAYIWYGHLDQPDNNPLYWQDPRTFRPPGMTAAGAPRLPGALSPQTSVTNPNGFYGNQKILGRMAILLGSPAQSGANKFIPASNPHQAYLDPGVLPANPTVSQLMQPFSFDTRTTFDGVTQIPNYFIQGSRCDLAGISLSDYSQRVMVASLLNPTTRDPTWYYPLLSRVLPNASPVTQDTFRFAGKPWATRNYAGSVPPAPLIPADRRDDMALSAPIFMKGCSQFIVEFAGDYTTQVDAPTAVNHGQITGEASDGKLDFDSVVLPNNTKQSRIRWYGLPRSYGDTINADVRPIFAFMKDGNVNVSAIAAKVLNPLPFEKLGYASGAAAPDAFPKNRVAEVRSYVCAWNPYDLQFPLTADPLSAPLVTVPTATGPKPMSEAYPNGLMPWMIRLTIRVDDPNGRLPEGQTIQYIFNLPHK